jgi:hypothetical protein
MRPIRQMLNKYVALLLTFTLLTLSIERSFAAPQVVGKLSTRGNQSIVVNGNKTEPGASILDGATIETPDGVGATVQLGPLGEIDIAPNTQVVIHYVPEQRPTVNVTLKRGCAIVRVKQGVEGAIQTPDGTTVPADQPDSDNKKRADVCFPLGATTPVVNTGAAASAGAGASAGAATGAAAGATGAGLSVGTIAAVVAGIGAVITGVVVGFATDNNSESSSNIGF